MKMTTAEVAKQNFEFRMGQSYEPVSKGFERDDFLFDITVYHRLLAILSLLMDADQDSYIEKMCKSGYSRLYFLRDFAPINSVDPSYLCVSKDIGFTASLAVGHFQLAKSIGEFSSKGHNPLIEYEEDFLFPRFMQLIINPDSSVSELKSLLLRWEEILQGDKSEELAVCKALLDKDAGEFADCFDSLIIARQLRMDAWKRKASFDEAMYAAEGNVYIDGICVLRIAEMRGIRVNDEYPLIPRLALRLNNSAFPADAIWRTP